MPRLLSTLVLVPLLLLLLALGGESRAGLSIDVPIAAKKLLIKDKVDPAKRKGLVLAKDPAIDATIADLSLSGALFLLVDPSPGTASVFDLPASGWTRKRTKWKYRDPDLLHGPVKSAILKDGLLRLVLKGSALEFPVLGVAPLGEVGGIFSVGTARYCFLFPGAAGTVKKDDPAKGLYKAIGADAPAACPSIAG